MKRPAGTAVRTGAGGGRAQRLTIAPLNENRWDDFVLLLGEPGGYGGRWCMAWRLPAATREEQKGVKILEGYPVVPYSPKMPAAFA